MFLVFVYFKYTRRIGYTTGLQYWSATYGINRRGCRSKWLYTHDDEKLRKGRVCPMKLTHAIIE